MKYEKAQNILPDGIIEMIQNYIDGGYIYIPKKMKIKSLGEKILKLKDILKQGIKRYLINILQELLLKY